MVWCVLVATDGCGLFNSYAMSNRQAADVILVLEVSTAFLKGKRNKKEPLVLVIAPCF